MRNFVPQIISQYLIKPIHIFHIRVAMNNSRDSDDFVLFFIEQYGTYFISELTRGRPLLANLYICL